MKVDSISIQFKTSTIPSRTKHESFNSFGSHTQLLMRIPISFFNVMSLSSLFLLKLKNGSLIEKNNIRRTLLTNQIIVSKVVFFIKIQRITFTLCIGHQFSVK